MLIGSSVVLFLLLQPVAAKPVRTTVEKLGGQRRGTRVEVGAVVLPLSAIQVQSGATTRYFALAVSPNGAFFKEAARVLGEVKAASPEALRKLEAVVDSDDGFKTGLDEVYRLEGSLSKLAPDHGETLAVQLQGFEPTARNYDWQTVVGRGGQPAARPPAALDRPSSTVNDATARIRKLAEVSPPDLAQSLPRYSGKLLFNTRTELRGHRKMVALFNQELMRRRRYLVQLSREDLELAIARLERTLSFRDETIVGTVAARDDIATRTFTKSSGGSPAVWLREAAPKGRAAVDRQFATTSLLVASFPSGASLTLAGKSVGSTPTLVPDLPVGSEAALAVESTGFARGERLEKLVAAPSGVKRVELVMTSTQPPPAEPEEVWFVEAEGAKVTVSQEATIEWTSPDGKSKARPELILRCASGEKEAYLFYPHGFGAAQGDLFIGFEDGAKPKKYLGAPSQNGLSLFFTGFWGKGTDGVIKAFLQHQKMTLTVKPKKRDALPELSFDLRGLDQALEGWLKACPLKK